MFDLPDASYPAGAVNRHRERMDISAFHLSRIYGQGWNAAKKLLADHAEGSPQPTAGLNPYATVEERDRWSKGFEDGLRSRPGARAVSSFRSWRPQGRR